MIRTLLVRGMLAGLVAAALAWVFGYLVGEPALAGGIGYEEMLSAAAGEAPAVGRTVQSTIGLLVALVIYGVAVGGIFALVFAAAYGRLGRLSARATAGVLALVGYVAVVLVPFLKYPSNPPASSADDTIGLRSGTFVLMVVFSVAAAVGAALLARRLIARLGAWNGVLLAVLAYAVVVAVVGALLPTIAETPADFPAVVLYDFRLSTLGLHAVLWGVLGLLFGALVERATRGVRTGAEVAAGS